MSDHRDRHPRRISSSTPTHTPTILLGLTPRRRTRREQADHCGGGNDRGSTAWATTSGRIWWPVCVFHCVSCLSI